MTVVAWRDVPGDPGLARTPNRHGGRPWVGTRGERPVRRFARKRRLDRVLVALSEGFGAQRWWPAETPFEVLLGAVLTQHTAWRNVEQALAALRARGPLTPASLLGLGEEELARTIRAAGTFRVKAERLRALCAFYLEAGGLDTLARAPLEEIRRALLAVHGVGPETADCILCYAAGRPTPVVDAYARRVLGRHGIAEAELPYEELRAFLVEHLLPDQVVIEEFHALCVRAGYDHCKPTAVCDGCPAPTP